MSVKGRPASSAYVPLILWSREGGMRRRRCRPGRIPPYSPRHALHDDVHAVDDVSKHCLLVVQRSAVISCRDEELAAVGRGHGDRAGLLVAPVSRMRRA